MLKKFCISIVLSTSLVFFSSSIVFAQAGSVLLKDGGGSTVGTYASILEAYTAIPAPVTQAYGIELQNTYTAVSETFPLTLGAVGGTSASNTITIYPASNVTSMNISYTGNTAVIILTGTSYLVFDGRPGGVGTTGVLTISQTATTGSGAHTIRITEAANYNTLQYLTLSATGIFNTAGPRNVDIFASTSVAGNVGNVITKCILEGSRSGIGLSGGTTNRNDGTQITDNVIYNFGYAGIWIVSNSDNNYIEGNMIYQTLGSTSTIVSGILSGASSGGTTTIQKNKIYDLQSAATGNATIRGITASSEDLATLKVNNNFISLTLDNNSVSQYNGLNFSFSSTDNWTAEVFYNTMRIGGTHSGGSSPVTCGISRIGTGTAGIFILKNNIVLNTRTGGTATHAGLYLTNLNGILDIDYNCYYTTDPGGFHAYWGTTGYNDLTNYKAAVAPNEQNSIFKEVFFVSNTDLHLAGSSNGDLDLAGTPIAGITEDIDGDIRHPFFPYKGGDEADPLPVELTSFTAYVVDNSVTIKWTTATEINNSGFTIERSQKQKEWQEIAFVPGFGTTTEPRTYSFIDEGLSSGIYFYRIKQIDFNGTFALYELGSSVEISTLLEYELAQNYPNPFNPITSIDYSIAETANVQLIVFNSIGEEIVTLVNELKQPGKYTEYFDASSLSSGVYFYKLIAGEFNSIRKMLLLK